MIQLVRSNLTELLCCGVHHFGLP